MTDPKRPEFRLPPGMTPPLIETPLITADEERDRHLAALRARLWAKLVPQRFINATTADFPEPFAEALDRWSIACWDGVDLLLWGTIGSGKSHGAAAALRLPFNTIGQGRTDGWPSITWLPCPRANTLLDGRRSEAADLYRRCMTDDILVLDDLGAHAEHPWLVDKLAAVIDARWSESLPMIVTTNLSPDPLVDMEKLALLPPEEREKAKIPPLADAIGARAYSRLAGRGTIIIHLTGLDRRLPEDRQ